MIGGWVPDFRPVGGLADSSDGEPGSEPDPKWASWQEGPTDWEGNTEDEGVEEQAESGAAFADRDSGFADGGSEDDQARHRSDDDQRNSTPEDASVPRRAVRAPRLGRHWGRFAELWVPEPLRDARVDPGRRGALLLLLVAALAAVVTAVGVWRNQPEPAPVPMAGSAATVVEPTGDVGGPAGTSSRSPATAENSIPAPADTAPAAEVVVSVTGLVKNAGLVTLPPGARVADAIAAAGGATAAADLTGVNLAAKLTDGDSIVLSESPSGSSAPAGGGAAATAGAVPSGGSGSALVNLNTADEAALDSLPGVGPVMAQNILAWRAANGAFTTIEQLQEISGIGPSRYAQISPLVTV